VFHFFSGSSPSSSLSDEWEEAYELLCSSRDSSLSESESCSTNAERGNAAMRVRTGAEQSYQANAQAEGKAGIWFRPHQG